jgi:hypothetical protein
MATSTPGSAANSEVYPLDEYSNPENREKIGNIFKQFVQEHGTISVYIKGEPKPVRLPNFVSIFEVVPSKDGLKFIMILGIAPYSKRMGYYYGLFCGELVGTKWKLSYNMSAADLELKSRTGANVRNVIEFDDLNNVTLEIVENDAQFPPCNTFHYKEKWNVVKNIKLERVSKIEK